MVAGGNPSLPSPNKASPCSSLSAFKWSTLDLTPALSSKERENHSPPFLKNSRDLICRTLIRETKNGR